MSLIPTRGDSSGALEGGSPEESAAILESRARALAVPLASGRDADVLELLVFQLEEERYAMESRFVLEIFRGAEVALIPGGAPPVVGVTAWRGELLPLLDLGALLGVEAGAAEGPCIVAVIGESRAAFGVSLKDLPHLLEVRASEIRPLPMEAPRGGGYVLGGTAEAMLVLDIVSLVRDHS